MEVLITVFLFGLGFSFFATQNTELVTIRLADGVFTLPIYLVVIISVLLGLIVSLLFSLFENIKTTMTIWNKEKLIRKEKAQIEKLNERVHDLEIENTALKNQSVETADKAVAHEEKLGFG